MSHDAATLSEVIRPTARAVILRDRQILVQVKTRPETGPYLTLPGGKQELGETMVECVARECLEEIGAVIEVGPLLHVADVFKRVDGRFRHKTEMLFRCSVPMDYTPRMGPAPDRCQIGTRWVDPEDPDAPFQPNYNIHLTRPGTPHYLGVLSIDAAQICR